MTAAQIRMARAALHWSISELAEHAGINRNLVRRMEGGAHERGEHDPRMSTMEALRSAFESGGVSFEIRDGRAWVGVPLDSQINDPEPATQAPSRKRK
jgi:transcriptional regulator with XRE-family HTH domain